jgi:hypothetical protein
MCFSTFYCGNSLEGCNHNLISAWSQSQSGGSRRFTCWTLSWIMLHVMIGAPHWLHTHIRFTSYVYNVFQHLILWLAAIWMQPQPDTWGSHTQSGNGSRTPSRRVWGYLWHVLGYDWGTQSTSYSYQVFSINIICFSTWIYCVELNVVDNNLEWFFFVANGHKNATSLWSAWSHVIVAVAVVGEFLDFSLGSCCRLWLRPPTHFILYFIHIKCFCTFCCGCGL